MHARPGANHLRACVRATPSDMPSVCPQKAVPGSPRNGVREGRALPLSGHAELPRPLALSERSQRRKSAATHRLWALGIADLGLNLGTESKKEDGYHSRHGPNLLRAPGGSERSQRRRSAATQTRVHSAVITAVLGTESEIDLGKKRTSQRLWLTV